MEKKQILDLIGQSLQDNIRELTNALNDYEAGSNLDEGDTIDPEDYSQQAEQREMQMQMQLQLDQARSQLTKLQSYMGKTSTVVEPGALVETDKNVFFIGLSMASVQADDKEVYGVSVDSPAYAAIRGKQEGEDFILGNETHTIRSVS